MSETDGPDESATSGPDADPLEEVREAAGAVVASLKRLAEAAEHVVEDPETFAKVTAGGRALVEAFLSGFAGPPDPEDDPEGDPPPGSPDSG